MPGVGHRERLRQQFAAGAEMDDSQLLELLLTYAIPRMDVAPLAAELLRRFDGIDGVLGASKADLESVPGCGPNTRLCLGLIAKIIERSNIPVTSPVQEPLWPSETTPEPDSADEPEEPAGEIPTPTSIDRKLRTFGSDEVSTTMATLPQVQLYRSVDTLRADLQDTLPYNSESTRIRRANYLLNRFFPQGTLDTPLAFFAARCDEADLKIAVFYEMLVAEPIAAQVAEDVLWPALPRGFVSTTVIREFIESRLPGLKPATLHKTLQSVLNTFSLLDVAPRRDDGLVLELHAGTLAGFLYVLAAEYPQPGMYRFEDLDQGPMRRWLLWDRDWMHTQIYALRDRQILAKVSEIDSYRQFTVAYSRREALERYFTG